MPLTVSHAKSDTIADWSGTVTIGNSTGGTTTAAASDLVRPSDWNSAHNITYSASASEIAGLFSFQNGLSSSTNSAGITAGINTLAYFEPFPLANADTTLSSPGESTWYLDGPYDIPDGWGSGQINVLMSNASGFNGGGAYSAASSGKYSFSRQFHNQLALYTQGSGASTSRLESVWSGVAAFWATWNMSLSTANTSSGTVSNAITLSFPSQYDASGGVTYGTTAQSGTGTMNASTMASTQYDSLISGAVAYVTGARMDMIPMATKLPPGNYWLAHQIIRNISGNASSTLGGIPTNAAFVQHSCLGLLENAVGAYRRQGVSVSNSTSNVQPFHGFYATTSSTPPAVINTSDIRATTGRMYWNNFVSTY